MLFPAAIFCTLLLIVHPGCAPHGLLSLRQEANGHFREAIRLSGIEDLYAERNLTEPLDPASLEDALAEARLAVDIDPHHFQAHLLVVELLSLLDMKDDYRAHLAYLLDLYPDNLLIRQEAARVEVEVFDDVDGAAQIIASGRERSPGNLILRLLEAELMVESGEDHRAVLERIDDLIASRTIRGGGLTANDAGLFWFRIVRLCIILFEKDPTDETVGPLLELARRDPDHLQVCLRLLFQAGMLDAAKNLFVRASGHEEAGFVLRLVTARLLVRLNERQPAVELLARLKSEATAGAQQLELTALEGHILFLDGKPEEALRLFRQVLGEDPAHIDAIEGFWLIYERTPLLSIEEAVSVLEQAAAVTTSAGVRDLLKELAQSIRTLPQNREAPSDQLLPPEK